MFSQTKRKRTNLSNKTTVKRKRNQNLGMIVENKPLPVRILSCKEGKPTQYGNGTLQYSFQHLVSKEEFNSTVFENSAPAYIDNQIIDALLPPEMKEYELEDLVDKGLIVYVAFKKRGDNTYINIVKVEALNKTEREMLANQLAEEERDQQAQEEEVKVFENEMNDDAMTLDEDLDNLDEGEDDVNVGDFEFWDDNELDIK